MLDTSVIQALVSSKKENFMLHTPFMKDGITKDNYGNSVFLKGLETRPEDNPEGLVLVHDEVLGNIYC